MKFMSKSWCGLDTENAVSITANETEYNFRHSFPGESFLALYISVALVATCFEAKTFPVKKLHSKPRLSSNSLAFQGSQI